MLQKEFCGFPKSIPSILQICCTWARITSVFGILLRHRRDVKHLSSPQCTHIDPSSSLWSLATMIVGWSYILITLIDHKKVTIQNLMGVRSFVGKFLQPWPQTNISIEKGSPKLKCERDADWWDWGLSGRWTSLSARSVAGRPSCLH